MASSSAAAESSSNGGDDLLTGDLGKNDYDWLLTPPGSPPASSYHYNSSENGESFLADPTALPNLVRSLAAIKTSRTQAASSKPDLITTKVKDSSLFSQRNNNGWNTAARSTTSNGPMFSTINSKKLSSSASAASAASMPGSRPLSRSSTPTKRNPNAGMLPSRPTTPTGRSNPRQPSTTTLTSSSSSSSRPTTPTMRSRTMESSVAKTNGNSHISATSSSSNIHSAIGAGNSSTTNALLSRASTPSKRPSPQPASQMMMRSSSVNKARPLPSRSMPSSRSTSPNGKAPAQHSGATWQQLSALPGFAVEPPPNLRTSTIATRPSSNLRGSYSSPMESCPNPVSSNASPSSNLRGSYSSPMESYPNPVSSNASRSDSHDLQFNARRASDGHDLLTAPHRSSEGVDLIGHQPPNGHDLISRRASDGPNLAPRRGFTSPARTRSGTSNAIVPPGPTLDRSNSTGASLLIGRGSGSKVDKSPNAAAKLIEKMIQSRRPVASTSSFHYSETMPRGTLMSQMKASSGGGKPASPTASGSSSSSRDVAALLRTSPRKPVDFSWTKESTLHSVVPISALHGGRRTQEMPSQHNSALSSSHDASLGQHGMINSSTAHDLELGSDLGEEFMVGEFGSGKLLASPMSQGDSFSSLVKDSRVNNWLGSPEMYRDEVAEANTGKTAATPNRLEMATIHKEPGTAANVVETPSNMCRHGSVASTCDLCLVKLRLQRLNEKCKASLTASFQASNDYSWKSSLSNGTLSARQH